MGQLIACAVPKGILVASDRPPYHYLTVTAAGVSRG